MRYFACVRRRVLDLVIGLTATALILVVPATAQSSETIQPPNPLPTEVKPPLSLDFTQLLHWARVRNPEWAAALAGPKAAEGDLLQAGMTPNPVLSLHSTVELPSRLQSGGLSISQELELGGKRSARIAAAQARLEATRQRASETERQLRLGLRQAYTELLYAQSLLALREEALDLAEQTLRLTRGRLKAGDVAGVDVLQLEVEVARRRSELEQARGEVAASRIALTRLFGGQGTDFVLAGELGALKVIPDLGELLRVASTRPDLLAAQADASAGDKEVRVQETRGISNLTASLGLARERLFIGGDSISPPGLINQIDERNWAASLSISIPLPINDTNEGNIKRAQAQAEGYKLTRLATEQKVLTEVSQFYAQWNAARGSLEPLEQTALSKARQALSITDQAYHLGYRSLLNVLQSRQEYLALRQAQLDAQRNLELSLARLEAAVGKPIGGAP